MRGSRAAGAREGPGERALKRILLVGGGPAHRQVLRAFAHEPPAGCELLLLAPQASVIDDARLPALVADKAAAEAARAAWVAARVVALDAAARRVQLADGRSADCELLSLDPAPEPGRDTIAGAREHALFARPAAAFAGLWPGVVDLASKRPLDVVVIGGDEHAVALALAIAGRLTASRVALVIGGPALLPALPERPRQRLQRALAAARITLLPDAAAAVDARHVTLASGARLACDVPVVATPGAPPPWLAASGLALRDDGWPAAAATLQSASHAEVFVAGAESGETLALNLRRFAAGGELVVPRPPSRWRAALGLRGWAGT